jgi:hypothetical protein
MYDIGRDAESQLLRSHRVTGRLVASVNRSPFTYPVSLEDGQVEVSSQSPIRRKLSATIHATLDDPECDVFRTEVRAEYGVYLPSGEVVWVPTGTFVVTEAERAGRGMVTIKGEDRWRRILNARFMRPVTTSGSHISAIISLLIGADGRITAKDFSGKTSTHRKMLWDRDRDKAILDLARAIGVSVAFNPMGVAEIRPVASVFEGVASWNIGMGDGGALIDVNERRSQGNTYNAVVAEGEGSDGTVPVRAEATITDVNNALLFGGGFSQRPRFYRSPLMNTTAQCQAAADALLAKVSGVSKELDLISFVHPGLDADDIVNAEVEIGKWQRHLVDSFTIPLGPGGTKIATRTPYDTVEGD